MRDILLAIALIWCLWNTYNQFHNFNNDKNGNLIDKMTLKILQIHNKRLDRLERAAGLEPFKED